MEKSQNVETKSVFTPKINEFFIIFWVDMAFKLGYILTIIHIFFLVKKKKKERVEGGLV